MCGLFGFVGNYLSAESEIITLRNSSKRRGQDSSGVVFVENNEMTVLRGDEPIHHLWKRRSWANPAFIAGHSRLITAGEKDNQPVVRNGLAVLHNGIVLNASHLWSKIGDTPLLEIDSEIIPALIRHYLDAGQDLAESCRSAVKEIVGEANCVVVDSQSGEIAVMSNTGTLYVGRLAAGLAISSESFPLQKVGAIEIRKIRGAETIGVLKIDGDVQELDFERARRELVPKSFEVHSGIETPEPPARELLRCSFCVLPHTMPFIKFDGNGKCNYCHHYKSQNPKSRLDILRKKINGESNGERKVLFPFSGGRDSSYGLHLAITELELTPIAYTYDWGMVTDLGRRNMSLMCAALGVEHIVVAANIAKKREFIRKNVLAWLARPHLGMVNLFTAGDKHFFQHIRTIQRESQVFQNLWSFNPLETTHFKTGFLGIAPDFANTKVYKTGLGPQLSYHRKRGAEIMRNPRYLNSSMWDTLSGEYFRSLQRKSGYFQIFDYTPWIENVVEKTLDEYGWERAGDTNTTWRIGDGTAAFYNYIYYIFAGFTEHDTLRSNQIREGHITRDEALQLLALENQPRFQSIKWYLDAIGIEYNEAIKRISRIAEQSAVGRKSNDYELPAYGS